MTRRRSTSARVLLTNVSVILTVTLLVLLFTQDILFEFPPFRRAELSLIDLRFKLRGPLPRSIDSSAIVIVEMSRESFNSLPAKWPWPKSYYARLVRNLKRAGAKAVGLDIIFPSADPKDSAGEREFRDALHASGNTVLAGTIETNQKLFVENKLSEQYGNVFIDSVTRFGIVNIRTDVDGILRRYTPFIFDPAYNRRIPTFSLAVLNAYLDRKPMATVGVDENAFHLGSRDIPRYDQTSFLINYYGPTGLFRRFNIADVLDDREFKTTEELSHPGVDINTFDDTTLVPGPDSAKPQPAGLLYSGVFRDKIVLVGSTTPEEKDLFPVPIGEGRQDGDNQMFGVEIHANVLQQLLDGNFFHRQPLWVTMLIVFGMSTFTFTLTAGLKAIRVSYGVIIEFLGIAIVLSEMIIIYWGSVQLFIHRNYLTDMMSPFLAVFISYIASTVYNYMSERKQKVLIKGMFSHYVNPTIVDELVAHPEKMRLGGERKELTVLFSDIQDFTKISESVSPEYLVQILNEYLNIMTAIIFANQGTLDKYEGDAILAFWGAPVVQTDHALRACRAALEMQKSLAGLRRVWETEGKPPFRARIGINSGEMIVGNMGGASRFDYTVIGDHVNLGSRLEGVNKQYGTEILMSEHTRKHVAHGTISRELDMLVVAGKSEPIRVYELIALAGDVLDPVQRELLESYSQGLQAYRAREFARAAEIFTHAVAIAPDDRPSRIYLERSNAFVKTPPPPDWNGVFVLTSK
ncbi:MAG TPA: adenylate/guanylate cyclase domain-containing protein [Bacteroidota bacterium]|nr:adenylate/guanylate cyclase domain-containing protein [Bacteroidota bacterium]